MDESIRRRTESELTVCLEEDCGYRHWLWFPKMDVRELADWWRTQERVALFADEKDSPLMLPGNIFLADDDYSFWSDCFNKPETCKAWINLEDDSYLITNAKELVVDKAFPAEQIPSTLLRFSKYLR